MVVALELGLSGGIHIEPFNPDDSLQVKNFVLGVLKEFGFEHNPKWDKDLEHPDEDYKDKGGVFYVAKDGEKIVGTVAVKNNGNGIAEMKRLYVDGTYRGRGLGTALVDMAIVFCRQSGFKQIVLDTWKKFETARNMYERRGFEVTRTGRKGAQIFMAKTL